MNDFIKYSITGLIYLIFQVYFFNDVPIFGIAPVAVYMLYLMTLPLRFRSGLVLVMAFAMGLAVDVLTVSYLNGMHAFAAVFAINFRNPLVRLFMASNIRKVENISFKHLTLATSAAIFFILIMLHQSAYYLLEAMGIRNFPDTLLKVVVGGGSTFLVSMGILLSLYRKTFAKGGPF